MSALPRKHSTGGQKLRKSNRVYPRDNRDEERIRRLEEELKKAKLKKQRTWFGRQGNPSGGMQPVQITKPQTWWIAQKLQNNQQPEQPQNQQANPQNQLPPVGNLWRAAVLITMAILAFAVAYHFISYIAPVFTSGGGGGGGGGGTNCLTTCSGFAVVQAPGCDCPPHSHISPTTPIAYNNNNCKAGCKQCICD